MSASNRTSGIVIKLMTDKGFGFIADGRGTEYFFHRSAMSSQAWDNLQVKSPVTFAVDTENPKGPRAEQVEPVEE